MLRRFKTAFIATAVALVVGLILTVAGATWVYYQDISDRKKMERSGQLGSALAVVVCVAIAPFWLIPAAKIGKERREAAARSRQGR